MAELTLDYLVQHRRGDLLRTLDRHPDLKGAGLITIVNGIATRHRISKHISGLPTYVVLEIVREAVTAAGIAKHKVLSGAKWLHDHMFHIPGAASSWDMATAPIVSFVQRPDFATKILPKMIGLGLATAGLVVAFPMLGAAAGAGYMAIAIASAGVTFALVGVGVGVKALYDQIVDPVWTAKLEESAGWTQFQVALEVGGLLAAGAGTIKPMRDRLAHTFADLAAKYRGISAQKALTLNGITHHIETMPPEEFAQLCNALRETKLRRPGAVMSGLNGIRNQGAFHPAVRTMSGTSPMAQYAARQIQAKWVSDVRQQFLKALISVDTTKALGSAALTGVGKFASDRGNQLWAIGSVGGSDQTGSNSGILNMAAQNSSKLNGLAEELGKLSVYITQDR